MSAELEARLQRLGAEMLDEAPPVTATEAAEHRLRLADAPPRNGAPVDVETLTGGARPSPRRVRHRRGLVVLAGGIAAASLLAVGLGVVSRTGDDEPDEQVAGAPVNPAAPATDASTTAEPATTSAPAQAPVAPEQLRWPPRVLLGEGWEIVTANERSIDEGSMTFTRDGVTVNVGWYRGEVDGDSWYEDKGFTRAGSATLLGHPVTIWSPPLAYRVGDVEELIDQGVLPPDVLGEAPLSIPEETPYTLPVEPVAGTDLIGGPMLEEQLSEAIAAGQIEGVPTAGLEARLVVDAASLSVAVLSDDPQASLTAEEFTALLASVRQVETAEWEAALPDRVVTPAEYPAVVEEMLTGVPRPDDSQPQSVDQDLYLDRLELAAELANGAACTWMDRYFTAGEGSPEAAEALEAIESIPDWPVSQELAEARESPVEGDITPSSAVIPFLTVNADGTLSYAGEVLDGYFAAQLCDPNAVG